MKTTRKIIKKSEAIKIAKANKWYAEEIEEFLSSCNLFNKDHNAHINFTKKELHEVVVYFISKEMSERICETGITKDARYICNYIDSMTGLRFGTCKDIVCIESSKRNCSLTIDLESNKITLTTNNPYFKQTI